jgi:hypothetical protein
MPDSLCCGSSRCPLLEEQRIGSYTQARAARLAVLYRSQRTKEKGIEKRHRPAEFQSSKARLPNTSLLGDSVIAEVDALFANVNRRSSDQLSNFVLALASKRANQLS